MVIKKKNEGNWEYCIYLGQDESGKKKYKRKCGFKTKKACIKEALTYEAQKSIIKNNKKSFKDICYLFLDDCVKRGLRPTTLITYKRQVVFFEKNFKAINKDIQQIKANDVYDLINSKISFRKNLSKRKTVEFLKYIFTYAKKKQYNIL